MRTRGLAPWVEFARRNLLTPIVFFLVFHALGTKAAIPSAVGITLVQAIHLVIRREEPTPIFLVASAFSLLFGGIDLALTDPRFFRLAPFAQNLAIGLGIFGLAAAGVPVGEWFAASLLERVRPSMDGTLRDYLRRVTYVASAYFVLKAALYIYLARRVDLAELIVLRSVIGNVSLAVLAAAEFLYRRRFLARFNRRPPAPPRTPRPA
jgi:intracellular septation protein A